MKLFSKVILLVLLSVLHFSISCQVNLDSLRHDWNNVELDDTTRLNSLFFLAKKGYLFNFPDSAYQLAVEGVSFASDCGAKSQEAKLVGLQGIYYAIKGEPELAMEQFQSSLKINESIDNQLGISDAYTNMGVSYSLSGDYEKAITYYMKSLKINQDLNNLNGQGTIYNNIGGVYSKMGKDSLKKVYYNLALEIHEKVGSKKEIAALCLNLGILKADEGNYNEAVAYFIKGLENFKSLNHNTGIIQSYHRLGELYSAEGNFKLALDYFANSLEISQQMNSKTYIAASYIRIADVYTMQSNNAEAFITYLKSLEIRKQTKEKSGIAESYLRIGNILQKLNTSQIDSLIEFSLELGSINENFKLLLIDHHKDEALLEIYKKSIDISIDVGWAYGEGQVYLGLSDLYENKEEYDKSLLYAQKTFDLAKEINEISLIMSSSKLLYKKYKKKGNSELSLEMYELYNLLADSIGENEIKKALIKQEYKFEYEKKSIADSLRNEEDSKIQELKIAKQELEIKQKKTQQNYLIGGLALIVIFSIVLWRKMQQTGKQNVKIEAQKEALESQMNIVQLQKNEIGKQHKQITDSIDYARNLQKSVLPSRLNVASVFPQNFIFFQPKDVVSGDFYWTATVGDLNFLVVADCTGHGVPGAFMTLVANNILNEIIKDKVSTPLSIVQKLHKLIKLKVGGSEDAVVKDSLDIGLISYNRETNEVRFVGTHSGLYWVSDGTLSVIKGDRANIGYDEKIEIQEHVIQVSSGDMLYMHTDGFPDQKGGPKGKKFYQKPIRNMLLDGHSLALDKQEAIVNKKFNDWKADKEQIDDVCLVGIRI